VVGKFTGGYLDPVRRDLPVLRGVHRHRPIFPPVDLLDRYAHRMEGIELAFEALLGFDTRQ